MMKTFWLIAATFALAVGTATARDSAQDQRNVIKAETTLCDAYEASDADVFRDNLDDHYVQTDTKGVVTHRDQAIAAVARRDPTYVTYSNHDQTVRVYGDAAVVTGISTIQSHSGASKFEGDFQYTETWIHSDGRWKLAASHSTLLRTR